MLPCTWEEVLAAPAYLISVNNQRYDICERRIMRAGYYDIRRFEGVISTDRAALEENWAKHPFPPHREIFGEHPAAVLLAHLNLWRHIIDNDIPFCTIFEDDTLFHTQWHDLATKYYHATPKTADMVFMGHHCGNVYPDMHIAQVPVYCLNAYMLTREGAAKAYEMITQYPIDENFGVIDMMLANLQTGILMSQSNPYDYQWYAWNTQMFPDPDNDPYKHPQALEKDKGLVFQQWPCKELPYEAQTSNMDTNCY